MRNGSGSIGFSEDQTMSNWFCLLIRPISAVLAMWWFSPLIVTLPSGAGYHLGERVASVSGHSAFGSHHE